MPKNHGTNPRAMRHQRDKAKVAFRAEKQRLKMERRRAKRLGLESPLPSEEAVASC